MMALSMAVAVFPSSIAPFFLMVFLGTFMIFSWVPLSGSWVLFFQDTRFLGTFLGIFRCFLGTFEDFLGTFGGLSERECQGGSFDVTDVFFDYRVFVACG